MEKKENSRFQDDGKYLGDFYTYRIVECPNCKKAIDFVLPKLACIHCGVIQGFDDKSFITTVAVNDFLQINCCGENLWAYNLEHLDFIEKYVQAKIREREPNVNKSLASRLPNWIKSKKNRNEILKCI